MKIKTMRVTSLVSTGLAAFLLTACSNSNAPAEQGDKAQLDAVKRYFEGLPRTDVEDGCLNLLPALNFTVTLRSPEAKRLFSQEKLISLYAEKLRTGGVKISGTGDAAETFPYLAVHVDTQDFGSGLAFTVHVDLVEEVLVKRNGVYLKVMAKAYSKQSIGTATHEDAGRYISNAMDSVVSKFIERYKKGN